MARRRSAKGANSAPVKFKHDLDDPPPVETSVARRNYHWSLDELNKLQDLNSTYWLLPRLRENPSPQEILDALNNREQWGQIPDNAIEKMLEVMRVPKNVRRLAGELLDATVYMTVFGQYYRRMMRPQLIRVAKDAERLAEALRQLGHVASINLCAGLWEDFGPTDDLVKPAFTGNLVRSYEILLRRLATGARLQSMSKPNSAPHRPRGSLKHPSFHCLLRDLRKFNNCVGGRLTYTKATGQLKGTLPVVLEMLRPYLPGVIPDKLSYSSIRRALLQKA